MNEANAKLFTSEIRSIQQELWKQKPNWFVQFGCLKDLPTAQLHYWPWHRTWWWLASKSHPSHNHISFVGERSSSDFNVWS